MKRTILIIMASIFVGAGLLIYVRSIFPQSQALDSSTVIRLDDAWIYDVDTAPHRFLRVLFTYQGDNPNKKYKLSASLEADGNPIDSPYVWQVGVAKTNEYKETELPMFWEFRDFPRNADNLRLKVICTSLTDPSKIKTIEFTLPKPQKLRSHDGTANKEG